MESSFQEAGMGHIQKNSQQQILPWEMRGVKGKASLYTLYSIILNAPSESNKKSSNILDVH